MSAWSARDWLGCALVLSLALLERCAPGGLLPFAGAVVVLLLGEVAPGAKREAWLRGLAPTLSVVVAAVLVLSVLLRGAVGLDAPPGLATLARATCLIAAVMLSRTPPSRLGLHVLAVAVALWTATALAGRPTPAQLSLTLATLFAGAQALAAARERALVAEAEASLVTGLPPGPRTSRLTVFPAAVVVGAAALPVALGLSLPRPPAWLAGATNASAGRRAEARLPGADGARRVEFEPELGFDTPRDALEEDAAVVARVVALPPLPVLLLRGAALERATPQGFLPRVGPPLEPEILQPFERLLQVELRRPQRDYLFAVGRPAEFRGTRPIRLPGGVGVKPGSTYPLHYEVDCVEPHPRFELTGLDVLDHPDLLQLPPGSRRPELIALAEQAAGRGDDYGRARRLASWVRRNHYYDLGQPLVGDDLVEVVRRFLFETRRGVCVEFSAATVFLLRLADIPARVATGYRSDEIDSDGSFVVRARHAHAWVEIPLEGAGWVPLDPAPGPRGEPGDEPPDQPLPAEPAAETEPAPGPPAPEPARDSDPPPGPPSWLAALGLVALGLAGLAAWFTGRRLRRAALLDRLEGSQPPPALRGGRERLIALLIAEGYRLGQSETPREFAARALEPESPLRAAVGSYTQLRFSGRDDPAEQARLTGLLDVAARR